MKTKLNKRKTKKEKQNKDLKNKNQAWSIKTMEKIKQNTKKFKK